MVLGVVFDGKLFWSVLIFLIFFVCCDGVKLSVDGGELICV